MLDFENGEYGYEGDDALTYEELDLVDEELDPAAYTENLLMLPYDWPAPAFAFGEHVMAPEHARERMIVGMRMDLIDESGVTPAATWMYYLGTGGWYQEDELHIPEPAMPVTIPAIDDFDPFLDAEDLP